MESHFFAGPLSKLVTKSGNQWEKLMKESYNNYQIVGGNILQHYLRPSDQEQLSWEHLQVVKTVYRYLISDINY